MNTLVDKAFERLEPVLDSFGDKSEALYRRNPQRYEDLITAAWAGGLGVATVATEKLASKLPKEARVARFGLHTLAVGMAISAYNVVTNRPKIRDLNYTFYNYR